MLANGAVYYCDGMGSQVLSFDAVTGDQLWSSLLDGPIYSEPIVVSGQVQVGAWDQHLGSFGL